jgi:hypothetical protein
MLNPDIEMEDIPDLATNLNDDEDKEEEPEEPTLVRM